MELSLTGKHGVTGLVPSLTLWVGDPALPWAVVWVMDVAQVWHCCGSGMGQQQQLWLDPWPGSLHVSQVWPSKDKKTKKKRKRYYWGWFFFLTAFLGVELIGNELSIFDVWKKKCSIGLLWWLSVWRIWPLSPHCRGSIPGPVTWRALGAALKTLKYKTLKS